ncbi:hypothetical protein, partial [Frigoribacterium sp. Leaf164]
MNDTPRGTDDSDDATRPPEPVTPRDPSEAPRGQGDEPRVSFGAPPLPGSAPRSLAEEEASQQQAGGQQPSYQQPG